jgi:PAS domain S-box-containing protein
MDRVLQWLLGAPGEPARATSLSERTSVIVLQVTSDTLLALSFFALAFGLVWFARCRTDLMPRQLRLTRLFGAFVFLCGAALVAEIITFWYPTHGLETVFTAATAAMSVATLAVVWPQMPELVRPRAIDAGSESAQRLRREVAAHEATLRELEGAQQELEARVTERTKELSLIQARFETALRGAHVFLLSQDADLNRTWSYSPRSDGLLPAPDSPAVVALKRRVLESGKPEDSEASYAMPEGNVVFALHVDPTFGPDGKVSGIMSAAIEVTSLRSLESEQRRLTAELGEALQRYETALHGSNVTVFTHDRGLRYTSISNAMFGRSVEEIIGRTDEEIVPAESRSAIVAIKLAALESGQPMDDEVRIPIGNGARWFDLHIEPLHDIAGAIVGLTGAAVDVTERRESEAHLRLVMRELTHRSKNLLAVIQAMARQTARGAGTIESFLDRFSARLQALARSHDLLVQEEWHGASLEELVRSQLGHYLDRTEPQITLDGPTALLRPEAAQNLGLALHELATNAAKYGALSVPCGRISIGWRRLPGDEGSGLEIVWQEKAGPPVAMPEQHGFGSLIIERNLAQSLDATVELTFAAEGVCCRIVLPLTQLYASH